MTSIRSTPYTHVVKERFLPPEVFKDMQALINARLEDPDQWEYVDDEMQHDTMRSYYYPDGMGEAVRSDHTLWEESVIRRLYATVLDEEFLNELFGLLRVRPESTEPIQMRTSMLNMVPGSSIVRHVDFDEELMRMTRDAVFHVNVVLYLNDTWNPQWGGELLLHEGADSGVKPVRYEPTPNRAVLFVSDDTTFHEVTEVACPPGTSRKSVMAYMTFAKRP